MSEEIQAENLSHDSKAKSSTSSKRNKETKEKSQKNPSTVKKLDLETIKLLSNLKDRANKKDLGRKIRDAEIIYLGLTLIESHHLEALKESTYSEQDRLMLAHNEFQKANGKITLDQFIGKLLRGEVSAQAK